MNVCCEGKVAEQGDETEEEAVGGEHRRISADDVGVLRAEDGGGGVGVEHQGYRRADG